MNSTKIHYILSLNRRKSDGDRLRLQIHRDISRHQPQCGRAAGWLADADSPKAGKSRKIPRPVPQKILEEIEATCMFAIRRFHLSVWRRHKPEYTSWTTHSEP